MDKRINRRKLITLLGGVAGAGAVATLAARAEQVVPAAASPLQKVPWPYQPLDAEAAAQRGFDGYYKGECMYGTFEAVVGQLTEKLGAPYKDFPFWMMRYGAGGIKGWATVCGALNGAAAAVQLVSPEPDPVINSLFEWYEHTALPNVQVMNAKFAEIRSVAQSPLCHVSIHSWTKVAGKGPYSAERSERCGRITGSVARQTILLLNAQAAGKPVAFALTAQTKGCMSCHEKGGAVENIRTKMDCAGCHSPQLAKHPKV